MEYTSVKQAAEALKALQRKQSAYDHAIGVLNLDATTAAPSDTWEGRGEEGGLVGGISHHSADLKTVYSQADGSPKAGYTRLLRCSR